MFDLLLDPGVITIVGTAAGAILLKGGEKRGIRKARAEFTASASISVQEIEDSKERPSVYTCAIYGQRLLEDKLYEANVITLLDMDVCEDAACLMCHDVRIKQSQYRRAREREAVEKNVGSDHALAKKRNVKKRDTVTHGGQQFVRPANVPDGARPEIDNSTGGVVWTWYKPNPKSYQGRDKYICKQNPNDVFDPFTGEYLGTIPRATYTNGVDPKPEETYSSREAPRIRTETVKR